MSEHYFSEHPSSGAKPLRFTESLRGRVFSFESDAGVFSRRKVDLGSRLLIDALDLSGDELVLDWGCGIGPIGIVAGSLLPRGRVVMVDINSRAVHFAQRNAAANGLTNADIRQSDGFEAVTERDFDVIVSNPPIRAGKSVVYLMVKESLSHMKAGGRLILVARTSQGVRSLEREMEAVFGNVSEIELQSGFRVVLSLKV